MSITAPGAPPNLPAPRRPQRRPQRPPPPGGGTYNAQLHPRGRGGEWIASKGSGYGAAGPDQTTRQLQQRLQQLGFHVPSDGKFGPQTELAVKAFQARYGLDSSGGVDPATMEVLQNPPPETLGQIQKSKRATSAAAHKAASTAARKTATAKAKAKAATRTAHLRATAQTGGTRRSAALKRTPGTIPGTSATVPGIGHLGTGMLTQGTGMTGAADTTVSNLQTALTQAGYQLTKDGRFGPQTEAAVKKLQKDYGLASDGVVGPATKALLLGLASAPSTRTPAHAARSHKPLPGQPAVLRTTAPHPPHGSRTAGSRMQLKGQPPKRTTLKHSASDLPAPDLEETAVAFGVGGQPSRSIKDARPEGEPLVDRPIWDPAQKIADPPDQAIPDFESGLPTRTPPADLTIPDARARFDQTQALTEAIAARKAAADGRTFVRAYARETVLRRHLEERQFSAAEREKAAAKGHAMSHGGFPIKNATDLGNAIKAVGRAKNPAAAKAHIRKRAKALGLTSQLPEGW